MRKVVRSVSSTHHILNPLLANTFHPSFRSLIRLFTAVLSARIAAVRVHTLRCVKGVETRKYGNTARARVSRTRHDSHRCKTYPCIRIQYIHTLQTVTVRNRLLPVCYQEAKYTFTKLPGLLVKNIVCLTC